MEEKNGLSLDLIRLIPARELQVETTDSEKKSFVRESPEKYALLWKNCKRRGQKTITGFTDLEKRNPGMGGITLLPNI